MERGGLHAVDILNTLQLQYRPQSRKAWGDLRQDFMMAPVGVYRAQGMLVSIYVDAVSAESLGHIGFQNSVPWWGSQKINRKAFFAHVPESNQDLDRQRSHKSLTVSLSKLPLQYREKGTQGTHGVYVMYYTHIRRMT